MKKNKIFYLVSSDNIKYFFFKNRNLLVLKKNINYYKIKLPSFFFFKEKKKFLSLLFVTYDKFQIILKLFLNFYKNSFKFFFFKLKLRGLGYRIKRFSKKFFRFFFGINQYFYLNVPFDIIVKRRRRTLLVFSMNLAKINDFFSHLLLVKKLDLYERTNSFIVSKKILFLKKRK